MGIDQYLKLGEIIATLLVAGVGLYLANNYRQQVRQKTTDGRIESYKKLWEITQVASPMRKNSWHEGRYKGLLSYDERKALYASMTDWYYREGNGIFLGDSTRRMYLNAKYNLLCPMEELRPKELKERLQKLNKDELHAARADLCIRQLSLLRHRLRVDLQVFGSAFFNKINEDDKLFLSFCGEDWNKKHWKSKPGVF